MEDKSINKTVPSVDDKEKDPDELVHENDSVPDLDPNKEIDADEIVHELKEDPPMRHDDEQDLDDLIHRKDSSDPGEEVR
jgi:hypothetical protein